MKEQIAVEQLQVGMFVSLKGNWFSHPFKRNEFLITKHEQLLRIRDYFHTVDVDYTRSKVIRQSNEKTRLAKPITVDRQALAAEVKAAATQADELSSFEHWQQVNKPATELSTVIESDLPAAQKSAVIFQHSVSLMDALLTEEPDEQVLQTFIAPVKDLAELVVQDAEVASNLLKITSHDYYTYTHCVNVGLKAMLLAREIVGTQDMALMKELSVGFFLHDIGKSRVDPGILNKPGKLTAEEFAIMKQHPERGVELLRSANSLTEEGRLITLQHHEKADGTGYPYGLKGQQIHLFSRICAFADIYDALTAERSYKKGMTPFEALYIIKHKMTGHFDDAFVNQAIMLFSRD